jgi:hypothetical protein
VGSEKVPNFSTRRGQNGIPNKEGRETADIPVAEARFPPEQNEIPITTTANGNEHPESNSPGMMSITTLAGGTRQQCSIGYKSGPQPFANTH